MQDRFYPIAETPYKNLQWDSIKVADTKIKGETPEQVRHCQDVMLMKNDTSVDGPWWVHRHWSISDVYTLGVMFLFWLPLFIGLWPVIFFLCLLPVSINALYVRLVLPAICDQIPTDTWHWRVHCIVQFVLSLPVQFVALVFLFYSHVIMIIFGAFYLCISSMVRRRSPLERLQQNWDILRPYQSGPNLYWHFSDCVATVAGSVVRQGVLEFNVSFTGMFLINPWIKYWVTGNIYLNPLGERFLTQIGQSLKDISNIHDIDTHALQCISRAKHTRDDQNEIDSKSFAPHYPYPPTNGRRYAIGMQFGGWLTTFVHTTHFRSPEINDEGPIATLSTSCALPMYRVLLWRNNPYHIYTGYVEANISTGWPSQTEKKMGFEHPMWLINSHNKLAADRSVDMFSVGQIDLFFDKFIPQMNHFVRLQTLGREAADAGLAADPGKGYETLQYQRMAEI